MLRKLLVIVSVTMLAACVSEPVDPAFIGAGAVNKEEAAKTRMSLGLTYLKNGNFTQAKTNLDRALAFAPRSGEVNYAMAFYYQQVGENELAVEYYENALDFSRNAPDIVNSYGVFLCKQGNYKKAKEFFLQAVNAKNYAATAETYENLAICTQSEGDLESAIGYFNSALNHQPTRASTLYFLTNLYIETQQWQEAKKSLWRYERNSAVSAETLYLNYKIAQGMNDLATAVGYGDLLVKNYPGHEKTKQYQAEMGKFRPAAKVTQKRFIQKSENEQKGPDQAELDSATAVQQTPETEVAELIDESATDTASELSSSTEPGNSEVVEQDIPDVIEQDVPEVIEQDNLKIAAGETSSTHTSSIQSELSESNDSNQASIDATQTSELQNEQDTPDEMNNESADESTESRFHVVQKGENLYRISLKYNVTVNALLRWNNMQNANQLTAGTRLWVQEPINND